MAQHVLIGVGGSGQHVVHAYLRLLTLSFPQTRSVPHVFILDADANKGVGADKRSTLIDDIQTLHAFLVRGDKTPSLCEVHQPYCRPTQGEAPSSVLGELVGVSRDKHVEALAHGFLADDDSEWGNDWTIELSKGMMANPKVGSMALAHKIASVEKGQEAYQFGNLFEVMKGNVRVAVVGSNFGGTGSGVIPTLVRQIDEREGVESVRAFMCLPWFSIEQAGGDRTSAARDQEGWDPKARNSSLGLHTYEDELTGRGADGLKKSAYVLCQKMRSWPTEKRRDDGNFDQSENRHVINIVQASAIQAFLGLGPTRELQSGLYAMKTTDAGEARGKFDALKSPHLRFWVRANESRQLVDLVADAEATAFILEKGGRVLENVNKGALVLRDVGELNDQPGLDRFAIGVSQKGSVRQGSVMGFGGRDTAPDEVFIAIGKAMMELATQIRRSLVWLDGHSAARGDARETAGVLNGGTPHLFGAPAFGDVSQDLHPIDADAGLKDAWQALRLDVRSANGASMSGSPASHQAFALFKSLFNGGLGQTAPIDTVDDLLSRVSSEKQVATADAAPVVVARIIARALHQRVIHARNAARRSDDQHDDRQRSASNAADAGEPMLNLSGLTGLPVPDARLVRIDLGGEVVGNVDPFAHDHPKSLAYLDPYLGLKVGNGNQINFAAGAFAEHGLRGIPNIAAPQLLQRWRLGKCRPETDEELAEPFCKDQNGRVRGTKRGIYLHARRINEAALWLLISADKRVKFVPDLFRYENESKPFSRLLRRELRLRPNEQLAAVVQDIPNSEHTGKPIFLWTGETWFLAANSAARKFFAELIPELPSVRYRYRANNPLALSDTANASARKSLDSFFAFQINQLVATLDGAAAKAAVPSAEPAFVLRNALAEVLRELPEPTTDITPEHLGTGIDLWLRSSNEAQAQLRIAPHRMLSQLQSYFCKSMFVFLDGKSEKSNGLLPLVADAWSMLESGPDKKNLIEVATSGRAKVDEQTLEVRKVPRMLLSVAGLGQISQDFPFGTLPLPAVQDELAWSFGIWPNFRAPGWNYYVISGNSRLGDPDFPEPSRKARKRHVNLEHLNEGLEVSLVVMGRLPGEPSPSLRPMVELGRVVDDLPKRINGTPEVLELRVGNRVLGSRRIELASADGRRSLAMMGVDFGTSNTCVAVQEKRDAPETRFTVPLLPGGSFNGIPVTPLLGYMDSSGSEGVREAFLAKSAAFFYVKNSDAHGDRAETLPSELLVSLSDEPTVAKKQRAVIMRASGKADRAFVDATDGDAPLSLGNYPLLSPLFTPLPPKPFALDTDDLLFFNWLKQIVDSDDQRVFGDLKWALGDSDADIKRSRNLRSLYLEQVLVAALAVLRSRGFAEIGQFVATKPEALSQVKNNFAASFEEDLSTLLATLCQRTGMRWPSPPATPDRPELVMISETVAALYLVGGMRQTSVSALTIDVGGGTTDVGICLKFGKSGKPTKRYTTSARFAGNKLLGALAQLKSVQDFYKIEAGNEKLDSLKALLKAELRRKSRADVRRAETALLTEMFFDGIFEYAFKVMHQFIQVYPEWLDEFIEDEGQKFKVALFGNGFKLFAAFQEPGGGGTLEKYKETLRKRLVSAKLIPAEVARRLEFALPEQDKSDLISVGGMDATVRKDYFKKDLDEVLLPGGIASYDDARQVEALDKPQLVDLATFQTSWLGIRARGGVDATRGLTIDLNDESIKMQFPLTYQYWVDKRLEDDLQNVFDPAPAFAPLYLDSGALYLTGTPASSGRSFSWLMNAYAKDMK